MKTVILTGSSGGLGKAIFDILSEKEITLICIARRFLQYQQKLAQERSGYIKLIISDLSLSEACNEMKSKLTIALDDKETTDIIFINNAAVINPLGKIGCLDHEAITASVNVNFLFPILLTDYLFANRGERKLKVINITSGAANRGIVGWPLYCSTKAAARMYFDVLEKQEVNSRDISVINYDPGIMDSKMQQIIRDMEQADFPMVKQFIDFKEQGKLLQPQEIANAIIKDYVQL